MAEAKPNPQQQHKSSKNAGNPGADDDPRHAPESGEPTETGPKSQRVADARGERGGERDESGRQAAED